MKSIQRLGLVLSFFRNDIFALSCHFLSSVILSGLHLLLVPFVNTIKFEDFSAITENAPQECRKNSGSQELREDEAYMKLRTGNMLHQIQFID